MSYQFEKNIIALLDDETTIKLLVTTDKSGIPHAVVKQSIRMNDDGNLIYFELLESSRTNQNLVRSIWFNKKVSVALIGRNGESFQIICQPIRSIMNGPVYRKYYVEVQEKLGDLDLAAVWVLQPLEVIDQSFKTKKSEEESKHPYFNHLDRIAK